MSNSTLVNSVSTWISKNEANIQMQYVFRNIVKITVERTLGDQTDKFDLQQITLILNDSTQVKIDCYAVLGKKHEDCLKVVNNNNYYTQETADGIEYRYVCSNGMGSEGKQPLLTPEDQKAVDEWQRFGKYPDKHRVEKIKALSKEIPLDDRTVDKIETLSNMVLTRKRR